MSAARLDQPYTAPKIAQAIFGKARKDARDSGRKRPVGSRKESATIGQVQPYTALIVRQFRKDVIGVAGGIRSLVNILFFCRVF